MRASLPGTAKLPRRAGAFVLLVGLVWAAEHVHNQRRGVRQEAAAFIHREAEAEAAKAAVAASKADAVAALSAELSAQSDALRAEIGTLADEIKALEADAAKRGDR